MSLINFKRNIECVTKSRGILDAIVKLQDAIDSCKKDEKNIMENIEKYERVVNKYKKALKHNLERNLELDECMEKIIVKSYMQQKWKDFDGKKSEIKVGDTLWLNVEFVQPTWCRDFTKTKCEITDITTDKEGNKKYVFEYMRVLDQSLENSRRFVEEDVSLKILSHNTYPVDNPNDKCVSFDPTGWTLVTWNWNLNKKDDKKKIKKVKKVLKKQPKNYQPIIHAFCKLVEKLNLTLDWVKEKKCYTKVVTAIEPEPVSKGWSGPYKIGDDGFYVKGISNIKGLEKLIQLYNEEFRDKENNYDFTDIRIVFEKKNPYMKRVIFI